MENASCSEALLLSFGEGMMQHSHDADCVICHSVFEVELRAGIDRDVTKGILRNRPAYLLRRIAEVGAVEATRVLVLDPTPSETLIELLMDNHSGHTLEARTLEWSGTCSIFSDEVKAMARRKLGL